METDMPFLANLDVCAELERQAKWAEAASDPGSKECVVAVKGLAGAPATGLWRRGEKVRGNNILPGTAIATFPIKSNGQFRFKGHAAIFIRYTASSFEVYDQWNEVHLHRREMTKFCEGYVSNDAEAFYVIELSEHPSDDPALCGPTSNY